MRNMLIIGTLLLLCGWGWFSNEPSHSEIANGFASSFEREMGIPRSALAVQVKKIGSGRWAVRVVVTRSDGTSRTLNATAVMDKNGDLHYYTD